jgi:dTDP-4-dehydrorhamnose reductase
MNKVLITGASGFIGPYLLREFLKRKKSTGTGPEITVLYNNHTINIADGIQAIKCDITETDSLSDVFRSVKPDTVIHLASGTPTRITGRDDNYIRQINLNATQHIAKLCAENNSLMIYTSTDLVYDEGINLIEDESKLNPLTIYAVTKLEGEQAVKEFAPRFIILRTSLVYGFTLSSYTSFFDTAYSIFNKGEQLRVFADQYRNPIYAEDAAKILYGIPNLYKENEVINFCGDQYLSRYDMCLQMSEIFGFSRKLVVPSSCDEFTSYPLVKRIGLNTEKIQKLGIRRCSFRENLIKSLNYKPE